MRFRFATLCAGALTCSMVWTATGHAEIALNDPEATKGWQVSTNGRVDAYLSWVFGETVNNQQLGNVVSPETPTDRYHLVGPQVGIQGNATPSGPIGYNDADTKLSAPRIRGGFASTILAFNVYKQVTPDMKLTIKMALWAGIQNALKGGVRSYNDTANVDWREQWMQLEGSWGAVWGGRRVGLYNRGGMRMNWLLMHQIGVGHPCDVDSSGTATCGHTGVGSMFPNRHAQIGYATPDLGGFQLSVDIADPAMIDQQWNRTPLPRLEAEATFKKAFSGTNELNIWGNGLVQPIARTTELLPNEMQNYAGVPADAVRNVFGFGGGAWGRFSGFGIGATGWAGSGLGTATAFGNTAVDDAGVLRKHFGYLAIANFRGGDFEIAASYGSSNVIETDWDKSPLNPIHISVAKEVRGIGGMVAYHVTPAVTFSVDGMNIRNTWHRGERQVANVISGGMLAEW